MFKPKRAKKEQEKPVKNSLFPFSVFQFSLLCCACAVERHESSAELGKRENPHPPNCVWVEIFIDYSSLFFSKFNVTQM